VPLTRSINDMETVERSASAAGDSQGPSLYPIEQNATSQSNPS